MATRLTTPYEPTSKPGPESPYPWDEWLEPGTEWKLVAGEDYECTDQSITDLTRRHARSREQAVSVYREDDGIVIVNPAKGGG